jgi:hypothetical protein
MNWEAVGAISQIVGAVLVGITLIYLAVQLRQNTSALKSSTFLAISTLMGSTMEVWATHSDLAPLLIKAQAGLDELSPDERTAPFVTTIARARENKIQARRSRNVGGFQWICSESRSESGDFCEAMSCKLLNLIR